MFRMFESLVLSKRVVEGELGPSGLPDLAVWLFFQIAAGDVLLPLLVFTYFRSHSVVRRTTHVSLCCTWILSGLFSSLLLYGGRQLGSEPSKGLCIAQTALLGGVPPMTNVALLALVCDVWSSTKFNRPSRFRSAALCIAPYCTFIVFAAIGAHLGSDHADRVDRAARFFYCSINWSSYNNAVSSFALIISIFAATLQLFSFFKFWRRKAVRMAVPEYKFSARVTAFTLYNLLSTILNLASLQHSMTAFPDLFSASVGMALCILFGIDQDVLRSCRFWRRDPSTGGTQPVQPTKEDLTPTSPSFDLDLLKRTDSDVSEKARLEALHAYYAARVRGLGVDVQIIAKPEEAFLVRRDSGIAMRDEEYGLPAVPSPIWRF